MNVHPKWQRLLASLLVLVMIVGMVPTGLGIKAQAVTAAEQTQAEELLAQIEAIESGTRYSKYVLHKVPISGSNVVDGESFFEGLDGNYIFVNKNPMDGKYYAFDPIHSDQFSRYVLDPVSVSGEQLFGAGSGTVITLQRDTAAKTSAGSNDYVYYAKNVTSSRARYYMLTADGRYINLADGSLLTDATDRGNALHLTPAKNKVSTTVYVKPADTGDGVFVFNSGEYKDTTRTGLWFDSNALTAQANYTGKQNAASTIFSLYKEIINRVNVDPLYDALIEAKTYLTNPNPYENGSFTTFLLAVENGLLYYGLFNQAAYGGDIADAEGIVTSQTQSLKDAMSLIKPYDQQINELMIPVTEQLTTVGQITKERSYFILGLDRNGFYRTFDPAYKGTATNTCNIFTKLVPVYLNGTQVETNSLLNSVTLHSVSSGGYSIQLSDGEYLQMTDNAQTNSQQDNLLSGVPMAMRFTERSALENAHENAFVKQSAAFLVKVYNDTIYLSTSNGSNRFQAWRNTNTPEKTGSDEYDKYLFRISDLTLELFKALEYVEPYAYGNGDGRYDETVYNAFISTLKEALQKYRTHRGTMEDATLQPELDALAAELKDYARQLTLADTQTSYIDIPLEILDFTSDKLLFEWYSGSFGQRFGFSDQKTVQELASGDELLRPLVEAMDENTDSKRGTTGSGMTGLVEAELVNGHPVYADYVVGFVAAAILTEWTVDTASAYYTTYKTQVDTFNNGLKNTEYQDAFWNKLVTLYNDYKNGNATKKQAVLGTIEDIPDHAGQDGELQWNEVSTAFDLAYYILNGVWTSTTDALPDGRTYNTVVTERDTLRLYYDEATGLYTIDSANRMIYDGYMIYNAVPQINQNRNRYPLMTPIDGLGFEKNGVETDPGTYRATKEGWESAYQDANMNYTLHASGSFVYYEDQKQKFEFVGDDDVYFFVNNKLVMDIGGSHSPAGFELDLQDANADPDLDLGLEDGEIYTFDMFYAERHTNGSNMKFSTNIKIVSSDTMTSKGQYAVEVAGTSTVGSDGKGGEMIDNQMVNVGDVVAYSFDIDNYREVPVVNLEFYDPSLGVSMSKDDVSTYDVTLSSGNTSLSVTDPQKANGVATLFKELIIEYTPYDSDGNLTTGTIRELDPEEMIALVQSKVSVVGTDYQYAPLDPGIYRTRVQSAAMLKKVLEAGIPMTCRFSIYGFCRKTISSDAPYTNELTTYCSYRRSSNVNAKLATITGKASRILRVPAASEMPDIPRIEITLDYGKPVQIPLADITNQIYFEKDSPASVGEIVGYVKAGYNGQLLKKLPKDLLELSTGDTVDGLQGTFTLREASMEYAMEYFMEMVETLYAVVKLNDFNHAESGTQYEYALVELRLIPANMMYYEAEDFTDTEISYVQAGGTVDYLFFDFDGQGGSVQASSELYGKTDWNTLNIDGTTLKYWDGFSNRKLTVYTEDSFVGVGDISNASGIRVKTDTGYPKLSYTLKKGDVIEVKIKGSNVESASLYAYLMQGTSATSLITSYVIGSTADFEGGQYVVMSSSVQDSFVDNIVTGIQIRGRTSNVIASDVFVDYIYLGPANEAPSAIEAAGGDRASLSRGEITSMKRETDNTYTEDNQDFNPVNNRTYDMVIDRDNIPAEAFFADFDGTGYNNRYRLQTQYGGSADYLKSKDGYDFDLQVNWQTNKTLSMDHVQGHMVLSLQDTGTQVYAQTVASKPTNGGLTTPLSLVPGQGHMAQVRFRVENCKPVTTEAPGLRLRLSDNSAVNNNASDDTVTKGSFLIPLDADEVFSGNYVTVTFDMDESSYYTGAELIDSFRVIFEGVAADPEGRILIDYVYLGPKKGMDQDIYDEYLYFGFDNTTADVLRYQSSVYGTTARNYDLAANWQASPSGNTHSITSDGYLVLNDKVTDPTKEWNCITAGASETEDPFRYKVRENDVYQIRFKISGTDVYPEPGETPLAALQFKDGGQAAAYCQIDLEEFMDGEFRTLTMPMNTSFFKNEEMLKRVRVDFSHILGDPTFTIDYVYIGPLSMADKVTQKADYLFFDFTNNDAAKSRYSNPAYGTYGKNFDVDGWHVNHTYSTPCLPTFSASAGTMSFKTLAKFYTDNKNTIPLATASKCNFSENHPLNFDLTGKEYFKVRMKIEGSTDTSANFIVRYSDVPTSADDNTNAASSFNCTIPATAIRNGEWFTLEGYITFGSATKITSLRFDVYNITMSASNKPITITYDYIYVGPADKASVTTESLFFGFDNEEADRERYGSYVYGGWNYDDAYTYGAGDKGIGQWVTSGEINGSFCDYTIDNEKGTLNVGVGAGHTGKEKEDWIYGPYIITTDRYGCYSMAADRKTLQYRPERADVVQVRFRVSNCEQGEGREPNVVFLFGGYDAAGNYVDYNSIAIMRKFYTLQDGYITVSIPTNEAFRDLAMVTNLGLRFQNVVNYDGEGLIEIDYIYVGPGEGAPYTYGYDSSYDTTALYSDGVSLYTFGNGIRTNPDVYPAKYTETRFSFTGTGFDLISRTATDQASIRVEIYKDDSYSSASRISGVAVNLKGELDLYQIPVYSKHDLDYGTYYVSVMVNDKIESAYEFLNRGNQFFLDAVRIYDPISVTQGSGAAAGSDSAIAYAAYQADVEAHPVVKEVRDILLTAEEYNGGDLIQDGAIFVDYSIIPEVKVPDNDEDLSDPDLDHTMGTGTNPKHLTSDILTYQKIGPDNETYLGPQQLIAFKILVFSNVVPNRLDIGAKTISADPAKLDVKVWGWDSKDEKTRQRQMEQAYDTLILGPSHQYYSLYLDSDIFETVKVNGKSCKMATIVIANPAEKIESTATVDNSARNVLSVTDVRVGFRQTVTIQDPGIDGGKRTTKNTEVELPEDEFVRFVVTGDLKEEINFALEELSGVCREHTPGEWETIREPGIGVEGISGICCTECGTVLEQKSIGAIPELAFKGASVSLQSDLAINFKIEESYFTEYGYSDPYVAVETDKGETVLKDYRIENGLYVFTHANIAPHELGDMVTATLYASYAGEQYSTEPREYSVATYCYNMLGKATEDHYATLRTLLVDILHYGAKTQEYMSYRLDSLCNAALTEEQLSYGTNTYRELTTVQDREYVKVENPQVRWKGAGLNLRESVALRFKIEAENYEGLKAVIRIGDETHSVYAKNFDHRTDGTYIHFRNLNAAQMSEPVYVTLYRGEEQVSHTIRYSIESYAYSKENDSSVPYLAELVRAMMAYGDSARAYVESTK